MNMNNGDSMNERDRIGTNTNKRGNKAKQSNATWRQSKETHKNTDTHLLFKLINYIYICL